MLLEWSTENLPARERFAQWREACCQHVYALTPERNDPMPFNGRLVHHRSGRLDVAEVTCDGHLVQRRPQDIRERPSGTYYVYVQRSGDTWFEQEGRRQEVRAGDIVLADPDVAFSTGTSGRFDFCLWRIERDRLEPLLARRAGPLPMIRLARGGGQNALIGQWLGSLLRHHAGLPAASLDLAFATLCSLVAQAAGAAPELQDQGRLARRQALLQRAMRQIELRSADLDLGPEKMAAELAISVRTLHQLFELSETTFHQHLTQARLVRAQELLRSPGARALSAGEIGLAAGFGEVSTFYRRFKQHHGMTPGEFRAAILRSS
jgi:AraC-like DNA-binding protein